MRDFLNWIEQEKAKGLVAIHFFPGTEPVTDIDVLAQHVYDVMTSTDFVDITNDIL